MKTTKHKTITEARHALMGDLKMLLKDSISQEGTNQEHLYTSAAFAAASIRPLMIKHGIVRRLTETLAGGRWQNGAGVDYIFTFRYTLVGASELVSDVTYEDVQLPASGKVGKSGDKSTYAAITTGGKYADLLYYYLPMVDDVESFMEALEALEEAYGDDDDTPKKSKKTKTKKAEPEEEEEPEEEDEGEEEEETPASSSDYSYKDGVFDIIEELFEKGGIEAVEAFTDGDDRKKITDMVDELRDGEEEEPEEEEEEPEEEEKSKSKKKTKAKKGKGKSTKKSGSKLKKKKEEPEEEVDLDQYADEEGYLDMDMVDWDNPSVVAAVMAEIDLTDEDTIEALIGQFEDKEAMKAFYSICVDMAAEESAEFAESFNDTHFETLQERFAEL